MKKILRLVTTSVLTLTLVACGEASSSVSNGTTTSSSVSSVSSAFANVSTITLSAATDVLTQTMGTQKAVVVQAALNANTNPSLAIEWLVNGTKSNQTGRVFEYTPAAAGTFVITARVGSVVSNALTLTVGAAELVITGDVKVVANNKIEITAPGGATVAVTNNEVLATSFYDLAKGVYVIDLKTALTQGATATVTLTREGLAPVSKAFTFDTRVLAVASVAGTGVTDNKDGTYSINRPHRLKSDGTANTALNVETYSVTFDATNLKGTSLPFKIETVSKPTDGLAVATQEGLLSVANDTKTSAGSFTFSLNKDSALGDYVYKYTVAGVARQLTIKVLDPQAEVKFVELKNASTGITLAALDGLHKIWASEADLGTTSKASTATFDLVYQLGTKAGYVGVAKNADGSYDIVKDYIKDVAAYKTFYFDLSGINFDVPATLLAQSSISPNQAQLTVKAPDGLALMRTTYVAQTALPTFATGFRNTFEMDPVVQKIDAGTPVGAYTYTLRILQTGVEIFKKDIVVNVKDFTVSSDVTATLNDAGDAYDSMISTVVPTNLSIPATGVDYMVDANIKTMGTDYALVKSLLVNRFVAQTSLTEISGFDFATYTTAKNAFVTAFTTAVPFFDGVTTFPATAGSASGDTGTHFAEIEDWSEDLHTLLSPIKIATFAAGSITATTGLDETDVSWTGGTPAVSTLFEDEASAITLINAYVAEVKALLNSSFDTFAEIDTAAKFAAAKTEYETAIASLYPTYIQFLNAGATAIKAGADGVYEVEKPMAATLDSKSLTFDLKITNYESAVSPAATLANSYVDSNGVKKEFLTFTKSVAGPGLLANQAFNTASTKVAIELDANGVNDTEQTEEATPAVYTRYRAAAHLADYSAVSNSVTINDIFALDVKFLTVNGLYTFTVNVGNIAKTIQVRVIDPKPVVNFTIDTDSAGNQFKLDTASGKWIATLGAAPTAGTTDAPNAVFKLNIKNITLPSNGELAFTFTRKLPDLTDSNTNVVVATATADNDGVATLASITNLVIGGAGVEYTTKGEYVYELTVAGVKSTVTLVVQEFPTVTVTDVKIGTASAVKFGGKFLLPDATAAFTIQGTAVNLSKATHYKLTTGTVAPTAGSVAPAAGRTATQITDAGLVSLNLANGIPVQFLTSGNDDGLYGTDTGLTDDALWILVSLYERTNTTSFDPLNPLYDLTLIGFFSVPVWYEPTVATP